MQNEPNAVDKRAEKQWDKSCQSYQNHQSYISSKQAPFELTLIDLLHISNFKGGNGTINEPEEVIAGKLVSYSNIFNAINDFFSDRCLKSLTESDLDVLCEMVSTLCDLAEPKQPSKIDGLGCSYLSALLHMYFPKLIPILDRRVLISAKLIQDGDIDDYGQIKNIRNFYRPLIHYMHLTSQKNGKAIREIDKDLFIISIPKGTNVAKV